MNFHNVRRTKTSMEVSLIDRSSFEGDAACMTMREMARMNAGVRSLGGMVDWERRR